MTIAVGLEVCGRRDRCRESQADSQSAVFQCAGSAAFCLDGPAVCWMRVLLRVDRSLISKFRKSCPKVEWRLTALPSRRAEI